jgi:hypothetical protein
MMITIWSPVPEDKNLACMKYRYQEHQTWTPSLGREIGNYLNYILIAR